MILNRAVALAEVEGPEPALAVLDDLDLDSYYLYHSTRADFLVRMARYDDARGAYDRATALARNRSEGALLEAKRRAVPAPGD